MEITEVRIKLIEDGGERLHAFCSITFDDCFVIRDLKIIEGTHGPFVAMPSRKLTAHCPQCGMKNHLRSAYCNQCGSRQKEERPAKDEEGRTKLYADIAHPINSACREMIQERVIREYQDELKRSKLPGYVSRYDDIDGDAVPPVLIRQWPGTFPRRTCRRHTAAPHAARAPPPDVTRRPVHALRGPHAAASACSRRACAAAASPKASGDLGSSAGAAQDAIGR